MIPHMNYQQYRTARRLVHSCCNYDCGNCLLLDNGEECVCVQSITYSLICKWFRAAVHDKRMKERPTTESEEGFFKKRGLALRIPEDSY